MKLTNGNTKDRKGRAGESLAKRLDRPAPTVWLSGQEAAEYVGVCWPTLRQFILDHSIPHVRIGTRWTIELAVLDDHMRRLAELTAGQRCPAKTGRRRTRAVRARAGTQAEILTCA